MPDWTKSILAFAFATLFAFSAVKAVRTGRLKPSRHDRIYLRFEDPVTFWFHVGVDVVFACGLVIAAVMWA
jgi:hypothetical protein